MELDAKEGFSPLHLSIIFGLESCVETLLQLGCSVSKPSRTSQLSPLMIASGNNWVHGVEMLLRAGANPNDQDVAGWYTKCVAILNP